MLQEYQRQIHLDFHTSPHLIDMGLVYNASCSAVGISWCSVFFRPLGTWSGKTVKFRIRQKRMKENAEIHNSYN